MSNDVIEEPKLAESGCVNPPEFAHCVNAPPHLITEAYVNGTPVVALCGHVFVPTRDPRKFPLCPSCKARLGELLPPD